MAFRRRAYSRPRRRIVRRRVYVGRRRAPLRRRIGYRL